MIKRIINKVIELLLNVYSHIARYIYFNLKVCITKVIKAGVILGIDKLGSPKEDNIL